MIIPSFRSLKNGLLLIASNPPDSISLPPLPWQPDQAIGTPGAHREAPCTSPRHERPDGQGGRDE
jgi:hypothetical protein